MRKCGITSSVSLFFLCIYLPLHAKNAATLAEAKKVLPKECQFYFQMYLDAQEPKAFAYTSKKGSKVTCRFSSASKNQEKANDVALQSCRKSALNKGLLAPCVLYKKAQDTNPKAQQATSTKIEKYFLENLKNIQKNKKMSLDKTKKKMSSQTKPRHASIKKVPTITGDLETLPKACHMFYAMYQHAKKHKAFSVAIDSDTKYVCKFSAKSENIEKAKEVALASCNKYRTKRAIKQPCALFIFKEKIPEIKTQLKIRPIVKNPASQTKTAMKESLKSVLHKNTPLNLALKDAIAKANLKKIKSLINQGADANIVADDRSRALFVAVSRGDIAFSSLLLQKGANPFFRKEDGNNLLVAAIMSGENAMLKLILSQKLDPNITCEKGNTPLHFALMMFDKEMMKTLYHFHARDDIKNNKGQTVQDLAKEYHVDLKRLK